MSDQELNKAAENIINDVFAYAELHSAGPDEEEQTLRLFQEVAQRCDEHIADLLKRTGKQRHLEARADDSHQDQKLAA